MMIEVLVGEKMEYFFVFTDENIDDFKVKINNSEGDDFFYSCLQNRKIVPVGEIIEQSHQNIKF